MLNLIKKWARSLKMLQITNTALKVFQITYMKCELNNNESTTHYQDFKNPCK